ncbi:hypothetical protein, partial [Atlantibacter hermannii]|uniref:hypothetical protein n=1 Tax=Atlantibacter hermannii TaxID=565 RepID=UPI0028A6D7D8
AGLTWLVNSGSAILMPDPPPTLNLLCFTERLLSLWDNALNFTSVFFQNACGRREYFSYS